MEIGSYVINKKKLPILRELFIKIYLFSFLSDLPALARRTTGIAIISNITRPIIKLVESIINILKDL
jgi:hypothetical protein